MKLGGVCWQLKFFENFVNPRRRIKNISANILEIRERIHAAKQQLISIKKKMLKQKFVWYGYWINTLNG
jgi:hypothetical protein